MAHTMADLRREVAVRLRNAIHGRELDTMNNNIRLPHMLGITPVGKVHDPQNEEMTLLDPQHPFWEDFEQDVDTPSTAREKVQSAVHLLAQDGVFKKKYPYGKEADIVYIEVERIDTPESLTTECKRCGEYIDAGLSLDLEDSTYFLNTTLDCAECDYSRELGVAVVPK